MVNQSVTSKFCEFVWNVQCLKKGSQVTLAARKNIFAVDNVLVVSSEIFKPGCQVENINVKFVVNINIRIFARRQKHKLKFNSYESEQEKMVICTFSNRKDSDQTAFQCSLTCAFSSCMCTAYSLRNFREMVKAALSLHRCPIHCFG